jgi:Xaa-Pro dipeptidase
MQGTHCGLYDVDWKALTTKNVERARACLGKKKIDALLVGTMENWRYLTGLPTNFTFAYAVANYAVLGTDEPLPRVLALDYIKDAMERLAPWYRPIVPLPFDGTREARQPMGAGLWPGLIADLCRSMGLDRGTIALDPGIPFPVKDALVAQLPGARFVNGGEILREARLVKNEQELTAIRNACQLAELGMRSGLDCIRVGAIEREVAGAIERTLRENGAENSLSVPFVLSGDHALLGYAYPSDKPFRSGELAIVDVGCSFGGYYSDFCRTVYLGKPDATVEKAYAAVLRAIEKGIDSCRPGRTNIDVFNAMNETLREATTGQYDLGWFGGHACGLGINEAPMIGSEDGVDSCQLEPGMFLCIEPGIQLAGKGLLCVEEGVVVTDGAPEVITRSSRDLSPLS